MSYSDETIFNEFISEDKLIINKNDIKSLH
jgi:hypothetical protein